MTSLFPPRENRSTSGTHDRSRTAGSISSAVVNSSNPNSGHAVGKRSSSNTRSSRPSQTHQRPSASAAHGSTNDSSSSARETFLNYFFGQNGPGPIAGSSLDRSHAAGTSETGIVPVGRDISGADSTFSSGLMAGKRGLDGNSAAWDMKSLGKHIEAVSVTSFQLLILLMSSGVCGGITAYCTRRNRDQSDSVTHHIIFQYRTTKYSRPDTKSNHAFPC